MDKTTFVLGRQCPTKMKYHQAGYPTKTAQDDYVAELADGGHIVHYLAQLLRPDGTMCGPEGLVRVLREGGCFFEVKMQAGQLEARADIIEFDKEANLITLTEVKSSSELKGNTKKTLGEHIVDITFQAVVLQRALKELLGERAGQINVEYVVVTLNKEHIAEPIDLWQNFRVTKADNGRVDVEFLQDLSLLDDTGLLQDHLVTNHIVESLLEVERDISELLVHQVKRTAPRLFKGCKSCEFTVPHSEIGESGMQACWGSLQRGLAVNEPHILDLYHVGSFKRDGRDLISEVVSHGSARSTLVNPDDYQERDNERQMRQIAAAVTGDEMIESELRSTLQEHSYPLYFIDFEAINSGMPLYVGSHPYEIVPFQWSVHVVHEDGSMEHHEWLYEGEDHPAPSFLASLKAMLHGAGTVYTWSGYEKTCISKALEASRRLDMYDEDVEAWAQQFVTGGYVDMLILCQNYYIHPENKGRASIKAVLPPIWNNSAGVRSMFPEYASQDNGVIADPYTTLPSLSEDHPLRDVREGTAAMQGYRELIFGDLSDTHRAELKQALLEYCKLDTAAMVMIWRYWVG